MAAEMEFQKTEQENKEGDKTESTSSIETADTTTVEKIIKHPLQNKWTLWFFKQDSCRTWEESQMLVASFQTVEDFWALYNHIELASKLKVGCDYSLFKYGIKPMWEDVRNNKGGRWIINLSKQQRATELDNFWMEMLLLLIGEAFDQHSDEVCGAVVNIKPKGDKVGVWTRNAHNSVSNLKIGYKILTALHLPRGHVINFIAHMDAACVKGSSVKCLLSIEA